MLARFGCWVMIRESEGVVAKRGGGGGGGGGGRDVSTASGTKPACGDTFISWLWHSAGPNAK
jgi:hypothetical protein